MKDEELLQWKDRLTGRLMQQLNRHFYPLACESFTGRDISFEQAFLKEAKRGDISAKSNVMGNVVRKYVDFRLALADVFLRETAEAAPFLAFVLEKKMDLDVTHQLAGEFEKLREGLSYFFTSVDEGDRISHLLSLLEKETGMALHPLSEFFQKETAGFLSAMKKDSRSFLEAITLCDPDFHEAGKEMPRFLKGALAEELGISYGDQIWESAQMMGTLDKALGSHLSAVTPEAARFLYHYGLFRMEVFAFYTSYLWQDRRMKEAFFLGAFKGKAFNRWLKRMQMQGNLSENDLFFSGRLYLKINMFMRQWAIFNPKEKKYFYRYFPNFTLSITDRTDEEKFDDKVRILLKDLGGENIPPPFTHFLVQETRTYMVNMAHTIYFAYTMGLKRPQDFMAQKWQIDDSPSLWNQMKRFFRGS